MKPHEEGMGDWTNVWLHY